jgi:isopenicillin-N epimerase
MYLSRRQFLSAAGTAAAAATLGNAAAACAADPASARGPTARRGDDWELVPSRFSLDRDYIHLAGLLIASHPEPVARAIERHRAGLDANPTLYVENRTDYSRHTREHAADYFGVRHRDVALTDSTTMGIALVYNGIDVRPGQEMLVSDHDYYSSREAMRFKAARSGATLREYRLFQDLRGVSADEIVAAVVSNVTPRTRVLAGTWVHSSTGLKLPVRRIADALAEINAQRAPEERVLFCLDGVHATGVEPDNLPDLGCDFFMAGTHKWLFGPRGTGILWGRPESQAAVGPTIPTFTRDGTWGGTMSPGGFKPFEHQWELADAFRFHHELGRQRVAERIRALARQFKEGLAGMRHVQLHTPLAESLSAGIVCFDVRGMDPQTVVDRLLERNVIASVTPYTPTLARVTPGLLNTPREVDTALGEIARLA